MSLESLASTLHFCTSCRVLELHFASLFDRSGFLFASQTPLRKDCELTLGWEPRKHPKNLGNWNSTPGPGSSHFEDILHRRGCLETLWEQPWVSLWPLRPKCKNKKTHNNIASNLEHFLKIALDTGATVSHTFCR